MKSRVVLLPLAIAGVLAACHGDDDFVFVLDAPTDGGGGDVIWEELCNPLSPPGQQGCLVDQKCSWVRIVETPEPIGRKTCVPAGPVALGEACTYGPAGETSGFDNCAAGLICVDGACADICGFDGSANAACMAGFNCTRYDGLFAHGDEAPTAGACNPGCDPLTQIKSGTNPPAGCGANKGCYLLTSQTETIAVCADAGTVMHNVDIAGQAFANSCVPGAQPRRKDQTTQTSQCGGLCKMEDVYRTMPPPNGAIVGNEGGLVTVSTTDNDNCQDTWNAAPVTDGTAGESCRYWWAREPFDAITPYSNTVGWCFKHAAFQYDSNGDMAPDAPFPRCGNVTWGDVVPPIGNPPHNDAMYFWCMASPPPMLAGAVHLIKQWHARLEPKTDRVIDASRRAR